MKSLVTALIVSLAVAVPAAAQTNSAKAEKLKAGTFKVRTGALLMGAGVLLVLNEPRTPKPLGSTAFATGMGLVLWGAKQRSDALRPALTFGAAVGRTNAMYVSRRW